jgi:hypothetical protein
MQVVKDSANTPDSPRSTPISPPLRSLNNASLSRSVTAQDAVRVLGAREVARSQWLARCPACDDDNNENLRIGDAVGDDGKPKLLMRCFARCAFLDIVFRVKQMRLQQEGTESSCQPTQR